MGLARRPAGCDDPITTADSPHRGSTARAVAMSSSGPDKKHRAETGAEQTGDFVAGHNTESSSGAAEVAGPPDPLLSLLRPPQADGELGRLAGFAVTRLLGRGGMGAVYAADDLLLHRKVALKVMRPELTARPEARERFLREAQTAGGLENDHVIPVYQVGQDHGALFIAMPLLKGEALDARRPAKDVCRSRRC